MLRPGRCSDLDRMRSKRSGRAPERPGEPFRAIQGAHATGAVLLSHYYGPLYCTVLATTHQHPSYLPLTVHRIRQGHYRTVLYCSRITIQSKSIDKTVATVDRLALVSALTSSPTAVPPVVGLVTIAPEGAALSADREAGAREQG